MTLDLQDSAARRLSTIAWLPSVQAGRPLQRAIASDFVLCPVPDPPAPTDCPHLAKAEVKLAQHATSTRARPAPLPRHLHLTSETWFPGAAASMDKR